MHRHFRQLPIAVQAQIEEAHRVVVRIDDGKEGVSGRNGQRLAGSGSRESGGCLRGNRALQPEPSRTGQHQGNGDHERLSDDSQAALPLPDQ